MAFMPPASWCHTSAQSLRPVGGCRRLKIVDGLCGVRERHRDGLYVPPWHTAPGAGSRPKRDLRRLTIDGHTVNLLKLAPLYFCVAAQALSKK